MNKLAKVREKVEGLFVENRKRSSREGYAAVEQLRKVLAFIDSLQEEPVSEELEDAAYEFVMDNFGNPKEPLYKFDQRCFKAGAKWQAEQFEKNRLKHCNSITNEQAELEQGFIDQHLDKYNRMPTFLDAIEYGMEKMKQQMMEKALITFQVVCNRPAKLLPNCETYCNTCKQFKQAMKDE